MTFLVQIWLNIFVLILIFYRLDDLVKDEEFVRTCSSCSDFGLLKHCARPGCPHSLCFAKTNHHPCISDVGEGEFWCPLCWRRRRSGELPVSWPSNCEETRSPYDLSQYKVVNDTAHLLVHTRLPLMFHTMALESNTYAAKILTTQLDEEYGSCKHLVCRFQIWSGLSKLDNGIA